MVFKDLILTRTGAAVSILRIALGWILFSDGAGKLFSWFGGQGMDSARVFYDSIGVPFSPYHVHLISWAEFAGGVFLIAGFLTRLGAFAAIATTVGAIYMFGRMGGGLHNSHLMAFIIGLVLLQLGGGPLSVDAMLSRKAEK